MIPLKPFGEHSVGRIGTNYFFSCGVCANATDYLCRLKSEAIRRARAQGWKRRKELGWVCPICLHSEHCPECIPGNECFAAYRMRHGG